MRLAGPGPARRATVVAMTASPTGAPDTAPDTRTRPASRWRVVRTALVVLVAALLVAMWAGIFLGFFDKRAPGTLDDPGFAGQAEPICAATKARLDALPKAFETTDHTARADVVAQSNADLHAMLDQLRAIAPAAGRDGRMTQEWLDDWSTYVANREDYVERLRADATARFYESTKSSPNEQISKPVDRFAYVNDMDSCDTPKDMA
jgi:hypothetical protein